jgi:hypothetical protein
MIRRICVVFSATVLAWLVPGCGSGGSGPSDPASGKPVFRPRPGEERKKEFMLDLLKKKGMMPAAPAQPKK